MKSFEIITDSDPIIISAGENAQDNFDLIDKSLESGKNCYWFQLSEYPSPHIIVMLPDGCSIKYEYIRIAAEYTKNSTKKHKNRRDLAIIYTQLSNVIKMENIGEVTFKSNRKVKKIVI